MRKTLLLLALLGCRGAAKAAPPDASTAPCARFGQTCEVSPGKLGTCVERACGAPPCGFVCQSQH